MYNQFESEIEPFAEGVRGPGLLDNDKVPPPPHWTTSEAIQNEMPQTNSGAPSEFLL